MIDTREWRDMVNNWWEPGEVRVTGSSLLELIDELDRLYAELEKYRWHPYPENTPEAEGVYQVTHKNMSIYSGYYWLPNDADVIRTWGIYVIAYRLMPEAYKPEVEK